MWVLRRLLVLLAVGAVWLVAARWWRRASDPPDVPEPATPWPPVTTPVAPPLPVTAGPASPDPPAVEPAAGDPWVDPVDGACPDGYPVKAKLRSRLYHLPGMAAYARTGPDRCYPTAEAAEADGFTRARR